jgi:hypothetical protein
MHSSKRKPSESSIDLWSFRMRLIAQIHALEAVRSGAYRVNIKSIDHGETSAYPSRQYALATRI